MTRPIKKKASCGPKAVVRRKRWRVSRQELETAPLIEMKEDDQDWFISPDKSHYTMEPCDGAIVKLSPPPGVEEAAVRTYERAFYNHGATSVKVMPIRPDVDLTVDEVTPSTGVDTRSLRQVALDRVDRTNNARDIKALRALVNKAMDKGEASGA